MHRSCWSAGVVYLFSKRLRQRYCGFPQLTTFEEKKRKADRENENEKEPDTIVDVSHA